MSPVAQASFSTLAVHTGNAPDPATNAVIPPISLSTTFAQDAVGDLRAGYEYARSSNPNRSALEANLAALEGGETGLCFSSGSAATATLVQSLGQGAHVISVNDVYGGTFRYLSRVATEVQGITVTYVDLEGEFDEESLLSEIKPNTGLIHIESPTNPTLKLIDIKRVAEIARKSGQKLVLSVDNTFMNPYCQSPISLGADVVLHSTTKSIGGHSDVIGGALIVRKGLPEVADKLRFLQNASGAIPSPFDCYLLQRSLKTLALRSFQHSLSALAIARHLSSHPAVETVIYPGLATSRSYELAKRSQSVQIKKEMASRDWDEDKRGGIPFGGMISFRIKGGAAEAERFMTSSHLFTLAESLGGVESLCETPDRMTHAGIPEETRLALGITPNLVRLSVGVEDLDDLLTDVDQALEAATRKA